MRHDTRPDGALGTMLTEARHERGLSQARLADHLCASAGTPTITRNEISRWERGERVPSGFWLGWLAMVLDLPVERLEQAAAATRRERPVRAGGRWRLLYPGVYAWSPPGPASRAA
jgi:transcriptional regulator with XRE-family HTH domain